MDAAHKTIEIGEETQRSLHIKGSDKGVASEKDVTSRGDRGKMIHFFKYIFPAFMTGYILLL